MEVMLMNNNSDIEYFSNLFKNYPDVVKVEQLKQMLPKIGKNKLYKLLQEKKIYSKRSCPRGNQLFNIKGDQT